MAWQTGLYAHPQGARLVRVMLTAKEPVGADVVATVHYREHEDDMSDSNIATVTIPAGKRIGFTALGGQVMHPMDSLVRVESSGTAPTGLVVTVGFNR